NGGSRGAGLDKPRSVDARCPTVRRRCFFVAFCAVAALVLTGAGAEARSLPTLIWTSGAAAQRLAGSPHPPRLSGSTTVLDAGGGTMLARVADDTASVVQAGVPWVFYGQDPEDGYLLRLAKLGPTPSFQTLDGAGGANGQVTDSVGIDVSASRLGGVLHVFYRNDTAHTLRHAWLSNGVWQFETLDGAGGANGRTGDDVGTASFA